jgi:ankyrin repeat protein
MDEPSRCIVFSVFLLFSSCHAQKATSRPRRFSHFAKDGDIPGIRSWLASGSHVNTVNDTGWTALALASREGHRELVQELLATDGIDPGVLVRFHGTALHLAAGQGHSGVVAKLLAHPKVNANALDENGRTPLHNAAFGGHNACIVELLSSDNVDQQIHDADGACALDLAIQQGHVGVFCVFFCLFSRFLKDPLDFWLLLD